MEITQENRYKDFLRKFVSKNFSSYYKFHDEYSDFIKPSHLSQVLQTNKSGKYLFPKDISFTKWTSWVNSLEISEMEKQHLILLRLRDELLKDFSSSSEEAKLVDGIIAKNMCKDKKSSSSKKSTNKSSLKFDEEQEYLMAITSHLSKSRFRYIKDNIKLCVLEEIATRPSIKAIELKQLYKKIF